MTSGDTVDRRRVAEAIRREWYSQRAEGAQANDWNRLAVAAIAALGLREETCEGVETNNLPPISTGNVKPPRRVPMRRLVSQWEA
jgi:hypothetical protein